MIDNFSIGLTHGLMMIAAIMLLFRRDLDHEKPPISDSEPEGWEKDRDKSEARRPSGHA
jgi:hypothetical protein